MTCSFIFYALWTTCSSCYFIRHSIPNIITCATSIIDGEYKIVIGARSGKARLYGDEKGILANGITEGSAAAFAKDLSKLVPTSSNTRGSKTYRSRLVNVLTERNLIKLGGLM